MTTLDTVRIGQRHFSALLPPSESIDSSLADRPHLEFDEVYNDASEIRTLSLPADSSNAISHPAKRKR